MQAERPLAARSRAALVLAAALALPGCASLADRIVDPRPVAVIPQKTLATMERVLRIEPRHWQAAGHPRLLYRVIEPADYGFGYQSSRTEDGVSFDFQFESRQDGDKNVRTRGTVVYLHGWSLDGASMLPWALAMAERGWRGVLVDLRNHGGSATAPAGFGTREGEDIAALVNALRVEDTISGDTYLFGISYGAVSAIFASAALGDTIDGVIALAPFANAADGIRGLVGASIGKRGQGFGQRILLAHARRRYQPQRVDAAIEEAGRRLALDLAGIDTAAPLARAQACTLLLHGGSDGFFEAEDIRALATATPLAHYVELPGETHLTLPMRLDLLDAVDAWLGAAPDVETDCPGLLLPGVAGSDGAQPAG